MPTPDKFQSISENCKSCELRPRTRNSEYCATCNAEIRSSHTDRARHSKLRMKEKPDIVAATGRIRVFTDALMFSGSASALRYAIWNELLRLDGLLQRHGPATSELRYEIRTIAALIRQHLIAKRDKSAQDARQFVHATELLLDVGTEYPVNAMELRRYASDAIAFYLHTDDRPRLGRAILTYANTWRLTGQESKARWYFRHALNVLEEWCDRRDPIVAVTLHNALLHNLRFFVEHWGEQKRTSAREKLEELAGQVATPAVWLETYRELVHFWIMAGSRTRAMNAYEYLQKLLMEHPFPKYGRFSLRRPEIHVLLERGSTEDRRTALELIQKDCVEMYLSDRHCYYYDTLLGWKAKYPELSLDPQSLPKPEYGAVILTYLPRNKVDAA
jgi:hypothetical protein